MINKKGGTFSAWFEVIIFLTLFVIAFTIIGTSMNTKYHKSYDLSFGLGLNNTLEDLKAYQGNLENNTDTGQAGFTEQGYLKISTVPAMVKTTMSLVWAFIGGGFINNLVGIMNLGDYAGIVILIFRVLYFATIVFILIKLVTRVVF